MWSVGGAISVMLFAVSTFNNVNSCQCGEFDDLISFRIFKHFFQDSCDQKKEKNTSYKKERKESLSHLFSF